VLGWLDAVKPMQMVKTKFDTDHDLLTSWSLHAELMPWTIGVPSLESIAPAVFLLQGGQTNTQIHRERDKELKALFTVLTKNGKTHNDYQAKQLVVVW